MGLNFFATELLATFYSECWVFPLLPQKGDIAQAQQ
jgi:hypothetical protein